MYIMLKELETPFKINKFIYALDLFILVGFAGVGVVLQGMVFSKLQMVFFVFNFLVGCFLTAPSFANLHWKDRIRATIHEHKDQYIKTGNTRYSLSYMAA